MRQARGGQDDSKFVSLTNLPAFGPSSWTSETGEKETNLKLFLLELEYLQEETTDCTITQQQ